MAKNSKDDKVPPLITKPLSELLRLPAGQVDMNAFDAAATPGFPGDKQDAAAITDALAPELSDLQERLFAVGRTQESTSQRILIVLQGMDTSGKGGVIRHAIGMVDPQGVTIKAFKAPTEEERAHHYFWRIERELPPPGLIGIFDRSHYEEVLVVRVNNLVDESVWSQRYDEINAWEDDLIENGMVMIKCFLNISSTEQKERLLARLDDPTKHWKYNPGDVAGAGHFSNARRCCDLSDRCDDCQMERAQVNSPTTTDLQPVSCLVCGRGKAPSPLADCRVENSAGRPKRVWARPTP